MADTSIQFTDKVWNPTTGCTMGCEYCYARRIANRHLPQGGFTDRGFGEVRFHSDRLAHPLKWKKPQTIFVDSMGDLFDPHVEWDWFYQIVQVMLNANQHTFLVFTKFAARMEQFVNSRDIERLVSGRKSDHIIWCATAENQLAADARLGHVCALKWGRKGVSIEPMLGAVDLRNYLNRLDWVVCGGQTGPGARPCKIEWLRSIVQQCKAVSVPCFVKQLGAHPVFDHEQTWEARPVINGIRSATWDAKAQGWDWPTLDRKGSDPAEWPESLRVQQFPSENSAGEK